MTSGSWLRHFMQIVDLRQVHSRILDVLFQEETRHWRDELHWDYRSSIDLIRRFIDSRSLGGYVALEDGNPAGYGFYVLEDHKGLIGGLFVSSDYAQDPIHARLLTEMLTALHATPRLERVEAQLMPFGTELDPAFLSQVFPAVHAAIHAAALAEAKLSGKPLSQRSAHGAWTDRAFESAAQLIQLAYANHVDGEINDQYRSEAGGMKFLRNIVLLPGCGQFLPEASFLVRPATGDRPIGMVLTSTVAERVGHTTQICVMPGYQGQGIGRALMESSIQALRGGATSRFRSRYRRQYISRAALRALWDFNTIKKFAAGVWQA